MTPATMALVAASALCLIACGGGDGRSTDGSATTSMVPPALALLAGAPSPFARGDDTWEVWTCDIPADTVAPLFAPDSWRLSTTPADLAVILDARVGAWSDDLSHGQYRARFVPGGTVRAASDEADQACVERVLDETTGTADGVLVIATAAHAAAAPGGWGRPGGCSTPCTRATVADTGRAIYVGASDFDPSWGEPALDLIEHELGHALDLPHSGTDRSGTDPSGTVSSTTNATGTTHDVYSSGLDVMSDPTARRAADPTARDAQGTIGANRVALGWIPVRDVAVVEPGRAGRVDLSASNGATGTRAAVIALDERSLLTIEYVTSTGLDVHLPGAGVSVHLVALPDCAEGPCTGSYRTQTPMVGPAPHLDLLTTGETLDTPGWRITPLDNCAPSLPPPGATRVDAVCTVALEPT